MGLDEGIIFIPVLDIVFVAAGIPSDIAMHAAIATSPSIVIPTSLSFSTQHHKKATVDFEIIKSRCSNIIFGLLIGALIVSRLQGKFLSLVIAMMTSIIALRFWLSIQQLSGDRPVPDSGLGRSLPFAIGSAPSILGLVGGVLTAPTLTKFNRPMDYSLGTAAVFCSIISALAA